MAEALSEVLREWGHDPLEHDIDAIVGEALRRLGSKDVPYDNLKESPTQWSDMVGRMSMGAPETRCLETQPRDRIQSVEPGFDMDIFSLGDSIDIWELEFI
jgi:hypothetical protein